MNERVKNIKSIDVSNVKLSLSPAPPVKKDVLSHCVKSY